MEQYSGTMLHLQSLRVKGNLADRIETTNDGRSLVVQTIVGDLVEEPPVCGGCGRSMHVSDTRSRTLKHLGLSFARIDVEVHEGTNNMIKTLRRQAYGFRDTRYFFLKIWERSRRRTKCRDYSSPQKCA